MVAASTLVGMLVAPRWGNSRSTCYIFRPSWRPRALRPGARPRSAAAWRSPSTSIHPSVPHLRISSPEDVATVAFLFLVALVTSQLAARMRAEPRAARRSAARNATVAGFARRLLSSSSDEQIAQVACRELSRLFECNAVMMAGTPEPQSGRGQSRSLNPDAQRHCRGGMGDRSGEPAGRGTRSVIVTEWVFYPVSSGSDVLGALGLARDDGTRPVPIDQLDCSTIWSTRSRSPSNGQGSRRRRRISPACAKATKVRSALLSSIGQDLEPRLAAMSDAASGLHAAGPATRRRSRRSAPRLPSSTLPFKPAELGRNPTRSRSRRAT